VAQQVAESHDGVLTILDEERLGAVANIDLLAGIRDGAGDLALAFLVGNTLGVAFLSCQSSRC
jgi:hypothetical protein